MDGMGGGGAARLQARRANEQVYNGRRQRLQSMQRCDGRQGVVTKGLPLIAAMAPLLGKPFAMDNGVLNKLVHVGILTRLAFAMDNGVARTPPLGWSTWETCGDAKCSHDACTESEIKAVARAMASNGLRDAGWTHINLDDCWTGPERNASDHRLTWDATRFPSGIPALSAWLHQRGFKFGLYTSAGSTTCVGLPGSRGYYDVDAASFAAWGVDYVKFDWCGDIKDEIWLGASAHKAFATAMNATGRPMAIEVVAGYFFLGREIAQHANVWRFCTDHHDSWSSTEEALACRIDQGNTVGGPGAWASMDLLTTGGAGCASASSPLDGRSSARRKKVLGCRSESAVAASLTSRSSSASSSARNRSHARKP